MNPKNKFLTPAELSLRWGGKPNVNTLANWRNQKKGPPYVHIGGIKYPLDGVIEYEQKKALN